LSHAGITVPGAPSSTPWKRAERDALEQVRPVQAVLRRQVPEVARFGQDEVGARAPAVTRHAVAGGAVVVVETLPPLGVAAQIVGKGLAHERCDVIGWRGVVVAG
jgi:hypothetical protein